MNAMKTLQNLSLGLTFIIFTRTSTKYFNFVTVLSICYISEYFSFGKCLLYYISKHKIILFTNYISLKNIAPCYVELKKLTPAPRCDNDIRFTNKKN